MLTCSGSWGNVIRKSPLGSGRSNTPRWRPRILRAPRVGAVPLRVQLKALMGTDLMQIPGIGEKTALVLFTEVGPDLSRFPTSAHFASWLGLCPKNKISGGKVLSSKTGPGANRAAQALPLGDPDPVSQQNRVWGNTSDASAPASARQQPWSRPRTKSPGSSTISLPIAWITRTTN